MPHPIASGARRPTLLKATAAAIILAASAGYLVVRNFIRCTGRRRTSILPLVRCLGASVSTLLTGRGTWIAGSLLGDIVSRLPSPWRYNIMISNLERTRRYRAEVAPAENTVSMEQQLPHRAYMHLGRALLFSLRSPHLAMPPIRIESEAALTCLQADHRSGSLIISSAHLGVWEMLPAALALHLPQSARAQTLVSYRPLHDVPLDTWLRSKRKSTGISLIPDRGSLSALKEALHRGGIVGLLPDQRPAVPCTAPEETTHPLPIELLGQPCTLSPGICALHSATGAPVWFAALLLEPGAPAFRLRLVRLVERSGHPDSVEEDLPERAHTARSLAQAYARTMSQCVAETPDQYFWWHDRWPQP